MCSLKCVAAMAFLSVAAASLEPHYLPPYTGQSGSRGAGFGNGVAFGHSAGFGSGAGFGNSGGFGGGAQIPIVKYENVNNGDGSYRYGFEAGNGISAQESGSAHAAGAVTSQGAFSYRAPDGRQVALTYTADERGFHPVGDHLPTPPPIPEAILRSIEYNRQHPSNDEGSYHEGRYSNGGYHY